MRERDSAGVRIVENDTPSWRDTAGWRLRVRPVVQIGAVDGAEHDELAQVQGAVRLAASSIVVADGASRQIRFFALDDGSFLHSTGHRGRGPGEFSEISKIWPWPDDSLAVWDSGLARLSIYSADGELGRTRTYRRGESLAPGTSGAPTATAHPVGFFTDGTLAAHFTVPRRWPVGATPKTIYRDTVHFRQFLVDGSPGEPIASVLGDEWFFFSWSGRVTNAKHPYGKTIATAVSGDRFYYSSGDSYEIRVFAASGGLEAVFRRTDDLPEFTEEIIEWTKTLGMRDAPPGQERAWRRWLESELPYPDMLPAYSRLVVDHAMNLWAQLHPPPNDSTPIWTVFTGEGRLLGDITLPDRFHLLEIGTDYVLGTWRDDLDVEYVRLYELVKP